MFAKSVLVASVFALLAYAGPCVRHYTIKQGDICDGISAANHVSTYQLATINAGYINPTCSNLVPGATICIGYENEDCSTTYVVKPDDTCDEIISANGINSSLLSTNNPQINSECSNLYIGEVLCVAKSVIVPPPPKGGNVNTDIPLNSTPASQPSPSPSVLSNDDDDDLPWCDEL